MTGLTRVSIVARKSIRYTIYTIFLILVGRLLLLSLISLYKYLFPAPPPAPTVKFGKLPKIEFPKNENYRFTYTLETTTGSFPVLKDQAKVYFVPKVSSSLLALDLANKKAKGMGFNNNPQQVTDAIYRFQHPNYPSILEMNIITGVFSISYDLRSDSSPLNEKPTAPQLAINSAKAFLSGAGLLPEDLTGEPSYEYLKLTDGKFVPALSQSEADAIKVNLTRKNYDELPSLAADKKESNVWFIMSGSQDKGRQILASEYHYYSIDENQFATYPLKSPSQAFDELKSGKGFISNAGSYQNDQNVKIRKVYLAYFDSEGYSEFYQPIYVFEGGDTVNTENDFKAFVPAVSAEYYSE